MSDKLKKMEVILDALIENAERLKEVSQQVISKEELKPLQEKQEELVKNLVAVEDAMRGALGNSKDVDEASKKRIREKLSLFEKLNASFIENLNSSHGLIRFNAKPQKK